MQLATNIAIVTYYAMLIAWSIFFCFTSMQDVLPWSYCRDPAEVPQQPLTEVCYEPGQNNTSTNPDITMITSETQYFRFLLFIQQ